MTYNSPWNLSWQFPPPLSAFLAHGVWQAQDMFLDKTCGCVIKLAIFISSWFWQLKISLCQFFMLSNARFGKYMAGYLIINIIINIWKFMTMKSESTDSGRVLRESFYSMLYYRRPLKTSSLTSRVVETVQGVPTSRMDCSACLGVPKACRGTMRHWCGNMQTTIKCANCATKTAHKGKSVFLFSSGCFGYFIFELHWYWALIRYDQIWSLSDFGLWSQLTA